MPEQSAQKTEQPTSRKLSKAKGKGQVPQSQELTSIVTLLVLVAMIALLAPNLLQWFMLQIIYSQRSYQRIILFAWSDRIEI
jgi:flagellar biosynthesis protein FlhB